jgi:hypothetical protein
VAGRTDLLDQLQKRLRANVELRRAERDGLCILRIDDIIADRPLDPGRRR